jgi:Prokaryotic E2 family E
MTPSLPPADEQLLRLLGYPYEVTLEGGMICLVIRGYELPAGLEPSSVDLLVRLPASWPDGQPDMFWIDPGAKVAGRYPPATEHFQPFLDRNWQRWSRHLTNGWHPGDDLSTWLRVIRHELVKATR